MAVRFDDGGEDEHLAPVVPLFPRAAATAPAGTEGGSGRAAFRVGWFDDGESDGPVGPVVPVDHAGLPGGASENALPAADGRAAAEQVLVKRLRTRQLSEREARRLLAERELDAEAVEAIVADFSARGYLDDTRLAEQLVHAATSRKGQGRRAIAQALSTRGIPREVSDAVLDDLPDDESERALEFARQKARSMGSLDRDAALRRLHGQLARRGFAGPVAMTAARTALDEAGVGASGVRFR